jgi:hypothetical protein
MLDTFTIETFTPRVGEAFRIVVDEQLQIETQLSEVHPWGPGAAKNRPRAPFSLVFHADPRTVVPQQIYRVEHDAMGAFELFLAPIGPDENGMRYEAVFT